MKCTQTAKRPSKTRCTYFTEKKVNNARQNIQKYEWAKEQANTLIKTADFYADKGLEYLWSLPPSQSVYRSYGVNEKMGCLNCGHAIDAYGNYAYTVDPHNHPWKLTCPSCKMTFPTNDFGAYYKSGLDETGRFDPHIADQSLLINTAYPEKGEKWGVDDGYGYISQDGEKYTYIAYYTHWHLWHGLRKSAVIEEAIKSLYTAYLYTGLQKYADAGIVLLARIAELYPEMNILDMTVANGYLHSHGNRDGRGKIIGCIWETGNCTIYITAYDALFSGIDTLSNEAFDFLKEKSRGKLSSFDSIKLLLEGNLLHETYKGILHKDIIGNVGMHHYALALAAVVLDDPIVSAEWLDFVFRPGDARPVDRETTGLDLNNLFVNVIDRDGFGDEASPGYNDIWLGKFLSIANLLNGYVINGTDISYDLYKNPKFLQMFSSMLHLIITDSQTPAIGDSAQTGIGGIIAKVGNLLPAYLATNDPFYARAIHFISGGDLTRLPLDIFSEDTDEIRDRILSDLKQYGPYISSGANLTGYGYSSVKMRPASENPEYSFAIYYGRNGGHGHCDSFNLHLYGYNIPLNPDLGYPEHATAYDEHRKWVTSTISHNTVMVDNKNQKYQIISNIRHYDKDSFVQLIDVENSALYDTTSEYRRTTAMITADENYAYFVDFFRVTGGKSHVYSFHGGQASNITTSGLTFDKQADENGNYIGTYQSPDIPWGTPTPSCMGWLKNVDICKNPDRKFSITWDLVDTYKRSKGIPENTALKLDLTMLGHFSDVSLCDGIPPRNKVGNPASLRYLLVRNSGENQESLFPSVMQAYTDKPIVLEKKMVPVKLYDGTDANPHKVIALKLTLTNGRIDYIVNSTEENTLYRVDDLFDFCGFFGVYSIQNDQVTTYAHDATFNKDQKIARLEGKVLSFTKDLSTQNTITVSLNQNVDAAALQNKIIRGNHAENQNPVYNILDATEKDGHIHLNIGAVSLIRKYADANDLAKGYIYNLQEGEAISIPLTVINGHNE